MFEGFYLEQLEFSRRTHCWIFFLLTQCDFHHLKWAHLFTNFWVVHHFCDLSGNMKLGFQQQKSMGVKAKFENDTGPINKKKTGLTCTLRHLQTLTIGTLRSHFGTSNGKFH